MLGAACGRCPARGRPLRLGGPGERRVGRGARVTREACGDGVRGRRAEGRAGSSARGGGGRPGAAGGNAGLGPSRVRSPGGTRDGDGKGPASVSPGRPPKHHRLGA